MLEAGKSWDKGCLRTAICARAHLGGTSPSSVAEVSVIKEFQMRSARAGDLSGIRIIKDEPISVGKSWWGHESARAAAREPSKEILGLSRAIEYATPTHNARTIKAYSVSSPVWRV